jgi:hypothetical protein
LVAVFVGVFEPALEALFAGDFTALAAGLAGVLATDLAGALVAAFLDALDRLGALPLVGAAFCAVFFLAVAATARFVVGLEDDRDVDASGSGAGVRFVIRPLQSVNGNMSVDLGGRERSVAKQLLDGAQIGSPLEQVRGCGVP